MPGAYELQTCQIIGGTHHNVSHPFKTKPEKKKNLLWKMQYFFYLLNSIDSPYIKMLITYFHFIFVFTEFFRMTFFYFKKWWEGIKKAFLNSAFLPVVFLLIVTCSKLHCKKLRGKNEPRKKLFFPLLSTFVCQKCQAQRPYFKILSQTNSFLADDCFYCPGSQRLENN